MSWSPPVPKKRIATHLADFKKNLRKYMTQISMSISILLTNRVGNDGQLCTMTQALGTLEYYFIYIKKLVKFFSSKIPPDDTRRYDKTHIILKT